MVETRDGFESRWARMKLEQCYPLPPASFGPTPDYYPDPKKMPNLFYCGRMYACMCESRQVTGWRYIIDNVVHSVCTIECLETLIKEEIGKTKALSVPEPVAEPVPAATGT